MCQAVQCGLGWGVTCDCGVFSPPAVGFSFLHGGYTLVVKWYAVVCFSLQGFASRVCYYMVALAASYIYVCVMCMMYRCKW